MPRQKKNTSTRVAAIPPSIGESRRIRRPSTRPSDPTEAQRMRMLWVSVVGVMLIVVVGWVFLLRADFSSTKDGSANPFQAIFERVKGVFLEDRIPTGSNTTTQQKSDAQLRELRERVFPQFTSPDTEKPVNGE